MASHFPLSIVCAESDRLGGVNITFNDGSTALFPATLLYYLIPKVTEMGLDALNIPRTEKPNRNLQVSY